MGYRVTAPYVTVKLAGEPGAALTTVGFYRDTILPANVDAESVKAQVRKGMVEKVSAAVVEPEVVTTPADPAPVVEVVTDGPVRPAKNASKANWVAFAVAQRAADVDEDTARATAEAMSHTELVAAYGG